MQDSTYSNIPQNVQICLLALENCQNIRNNYEYYLLNFKKYVVIRKIILMLESVRSVG